MKHITKFNSVEDALSCQGLKTPQIVSINGGGLVQASKAKYGDEITIKQEGGKLIPEEAQSEPVELVTIYVDNIETEVDSSKTYYELGYEGYYWYDTYEYPEDPNSNLIAEDDYPVKDECIYSTCSPEGTYYEAYEAGINDESLGSSLDPYIDLDNEEDKLWFDRYISGWKNNENYNGEDIITIIHYEATAGFEEDADQRLSLIAVEPGMTISEFVDNEEYNKNHYSHNTYNNDVLIAWATEIIDNYYSNNKLSEDTVLSENEIYYYCDIQRCLLGDTLVTMSDGSTKQIKDIKLNDEVLSLDLTTGEQVIRKVIYTDTLENKVTTVWDEWEFSDGTIIKTAHRHEFYNVEAGRFKYLDEWELGEHTYKIDGTTPELINHIVHEEEVNHYKITLEGSNNFFANGLLNGDRYCNNLDISILK